MGKLRATNHSGKRGAGCAHSTKDLEQDEEPSSAQQRAAKKKVRTSSKRYKGVKRQPRPRASPDMISIERAGTGASEAAGLHIHSSSITRQPVHKITHTRLLLPGRAAPASSRRSRRGC